MKAYFNNVITGDNVMDIILGVGKVFNVRGIGDNIEIHTIFQTSDSPLAQICVYDKDGICKIASSVELTANKKQTLFYNKDIFTSELDMSDVEDNEIISNKTVYKNLELDLLEVKTKSGVWLESKFIYSNLLEDMLSDLDNYYFRKSTSKKRHDKVWNKDYTKIIIETNTIYHKPLIDLADYMYTVSMLRDALKKLVPGMFNGEGINGCYGIIPFDGSCILETKYDSPSSLYTPLGRVNITRGGSQDEYKLIDLINHKDIKLNKLSDKDDNGTCFYEIVSYRDVQFTTIGSAKSLLCKDNGYVIFAGFMEDRNSGGICIKEECLDVYRTHNLYKNQELLDAIVSIKPKIKDNLNIS